MVTQFVSLDIFEHKGDYMTKPVIDPESPEWEELIRKEFLENPTAEAETIGNSEGVRAKSTELEFQYKTPKKWKAISINM